MTIRFERDGPIGRILIDRPDKRNAMNHMMWEAFPRALHQAFIDRAVRVIIVQSSTPGVFCAGADIQELLSHKSNTLWRASNQAAINKVQHELARAVKPTIAFVDGDCVGGGCGLALACDMRVATPRARLGITPSKLGLVYPLHDTKLLTDLIGPGQAKRLLFSGMLVGADEALAIGLVQEIAETADDLAHIIANNSPHSCREIKNFVRLILDGQKDDNAATLDVFADAFTKPDFLEGASAFIEKRKADFK
jgi:enoyl-CoA hydratase/carnithine racemase